MGKKKILIVEDEGIVALNLQHRLQHMGYEVAGVADSGAQSLSLMARELPDLVLMDIHIKGEMDGIEVARRIGLEHATPVVYLTAYSEDATLERARHTRPYGYLIKPFSERELHATIQMALERHGVQTALTESQRVLSQALSAASMGMVEVDREARTVSLTGVPARMLGFDACGTLPLPAFLDRVIDEDRETLREELMVCDRQGKAVNQVFRVQLPDGRLRWLQLDAAGLSTQRISGVARDVTEREEARVGLERLNMSSRNGSRRAPPSCASTCASSSRASSSSSTARPATTNGPSATARCSPLGRCASRSRRDWREPMRSCCCCRCSSPIRA